MKHEDVPQEGNRTLGGHRKALYAKDERGRLQTVESTGWAVEELVTSMAVAEFRERAEEARRRVDAGVSSPLEFYMYLRRMDVQVLAQSSGLWQWRVRRHLRPGPFRRVGRRALARYADALGLPEDALRRWPPEETP